ncbi:MAG: hypothetical protein VX310_05210, partial [Gemmatimonadota bacterium]|nr:hypothetical protein [Gemmatimonadota bacterium]
GRSWRLDVSNLVQGAPRRGPQIAEPACDGETVTTVRTSQRSLDHPSALEAIGDEDQAEPRPTAGADQPVRKQDMQGYCESGL